MAETPDRPLSESGAVWTAIAGGTFAGAGFLVACPLLRNPILRTLAGPSGRFPVLVALATLPLSALCWRLVVERPNRPTPARGAVVGLFIGLAAHPATWTLVFVDDALMSGDNPIGAGLVTVVILFSDVSIENAGVITAVAGVLAGIGLALLRTWTASLQHEGGRSLRVVVGSLLFTAVVTVVVARFAAVVLPRLVAASLLAVVLTTVTLRRLPVVRVVLTRAYSRSGEDLTATFSDQSFLLRHTLVLVGGGVIFYLAGHVYVGVTATLYSLTLADSSLVDRWWSVRIRDATVLLYPVLVLGGSVAIALLGHCRWSRREGDYSSRRLAVEWTLFLGLVVASYTGAFLVCYLV